MGSSLEARQPPYCIALVSGCRFLTIKLLGGVIKPTKINMSTFKERLVDEKTQLDEKIEKLEAFTLSENFQKIEAVQMSLLNAQLFAMKTYSQILVERLAWLKD